MLRWILVAMIVSPAAPARETDGLAVEWSGVPGCPDPTAAADRVRARLPVASPPVRMQGRVRTDGSALALDLEYAIGDAPVVRRTIGSPDCATLLDAAALVVAVAVDAVAVAAAISPPPTPATVAPRIAAPMDHDASRSEVARIARPAEPATTPRLRPRIAVGLRATGGVWLGAMPRPAPVVGFDVIVPARHRFRAELGALAIPRSRVDVAPDAGAELFLASAVVRGCFAWMLRGRVRPTSCLGIAGGAVGGSGRGDAIAPRTGREAWAAASVDFEIAVGVVRRLAVVLGGAGWLHLRRPGFHLDRIGTVSRMGEASLALRAGLLVLLP